MESEKVYSTHDRMVAKKKVFYNENQIFEAQKKVYTDFIIEYFLNSIFTRTKNFADKKKKTWQEKRKWKKKN